MDVKKSLNRKSKERNEVTKGSETTAKEEPIYSTNGEADSKDISFDQMQKVQQRR